MTRMQWAVKVWAAAVVLAAAGAAAQPLSPAQQVSKPAGASAAASAEAARAASGATVAVIVYNRQLVVFRHPLLGYDVTSRAAQARHRVGELMARRGPGNVTIDHLGDSAAIMIDGSLAFLIAPGDADALEGITLDGTAQQAATVLRQVIAEHRQLFDLRAMSRAAALALAYMLAFGAALWLLTKVRHRLSARLSQLAQRHSRPLAVAGVPLLDRNWMLALSARGASFAFWLVVCIAVYEWMGQVLVLFPYTRAWGERLNGFLVDTASQLVGGMVRAVPSLLVAGAIFAIAHLSIRLLNPFFDRVQTGRARTRWLDRHTARPTRRLVTVAIWLLALVMAYPYLPGAETDAFKGVSVFVGLMISLGGASTVGQALSGLTLTYARTFVVGEYVRIGEHEGRVSEVGLYQTRLRSSQGGELVLPNSLVLGSVTRNYSRAVVGGGFAVDTAVTIGYDAPWRQVHAMLEEAARRTEGVKAEPGPYVLQTALSDFYVEYRLVMHVAPGVAVSRPDVLDRLHRNILDVFNEHGVQIMSPHYRGDPAEAKLVPKAKWFEPPAAPDAGRADPPPIQERQS